MKALILLVGLGISILSVAQPSTEVYVFDLEEDEGVFTIFNPINISDNDGYDNQPSFWPDGNSVLYARTVNGQTEIARYYLGSRKTDIITSTLQGSEYSPTPTPDGRISSIRLDTTGLQLLYVYDLEGNAEVLVPDLKIGYHAWLNKKELVSFVLGDPATLQLVDVKSGKATTLASKIGRSLQDIPVSNFFSYVDKSNDEVWVITAMDKKGKQERIISTVEGSEDFVWTKTGKIIMGKDSKLFSWGYGGTWTEIIDLADFGLGSVTRVAISPKQDRLAVVVDGK